MAQSQSRPRFLSVLLTFFTVVAVALAGIGVYGVISFSVARRSNEIGIRMAMGADSARILRMVLRQGVMLGTAGVVIGVGAAVWLTPFLRTLLFGIQPLDAPTFAGHDRTAVRSDTFGVLDAGAQSNASRSGCGAAG